jgi:hypothetical protein
MADDRPASAASNLREPAAAVPLLGSFQPRTGTMDAWNAAYVRVEDYLRAHRIHNRLHLGRIIQTVLERAARRHEARPDLEPTALAVEETVALMDVWFADILDEKGQSRERLAVDGRVALLLCDGPERWPYGFLNTDDVSPDFVRSMRSSFLEAGPHLAVSSMVPRPIDLGPITEAAGETFERIEKWPVLRALFLWTVFALVLGGIFWLTR